MRSCAGSRRRWVSAAAVGALAAALASCGASKPPKAANGTNTAACYSGSCEIRVDGDTTFGVDSSLGIDSVAVTVEESHATIEGTGPGISVSTTLGRTGTHGGLNRLDVTLVWISGSTAVLSFSPS